MVHRITVMNTVNANVLDGKNNSNETAVDWRTVRNKNALHPSMENYMIIGYNYMTRGHNYDQSGDVLHQYVFDPYRYHNNNGNVEPGVINIQPVARQLSRDESDESNDDASSSHGTARNMTNSTGHNENNNEVKYNPNVLLQVELNPAEQTYGDVKPVMNVQYKEEEVNQKPIEKEHKVYKETGTQCTETKIECSPNIDSMVGLNQNAGNKIGGNYSYPEINFHRLAKSLAENPMIYRCNACDNEFLTKNDLDTHLRTHNGHTGQKSRLRSCDYCDSSFTNKRKHYEHFKTHFNDQSHDCAFCHSSFVTEFYLKEHIKSHSTGPLVFPEKSGNKDERLFPCNFCNRTFPNRSSVMFHLRLHTAEIVFQCTFCSKTFLNKSELNLHVRIHTGNKTHSCHLCNKLFLTTSNLKQHIRYHTGDKPFSCTNCQKCFSNKSNLMQHMKVHTGDKPHHCTFCEKAFTTTSNLTQHIRIHTGDKPYLCKFCGKAFINNSNLSQHSKVHCPTLTGKPRRKPKTPQAHHQVQVQQQVAHQPQSQQQVQVQVQQEQSQMQHQEHHQIRPQSVLSQQPHTPHPLHQQQMQYSQF